jgi:hypothetical protein
MKTPKPRKPLFRHDCDKCVFLGTLNRKDLYVCPIGDKQIGTLVARASSVPSDYASGLQFALDYEKRHYTVSENGEALYIALCLARSNGYKIREELG